MERGGRGRWKAAWAGPALAVSACATLGACANPFWSVAAKSDETAQGPAAPPAGEPPVNDLPIAVRAPAGQGALPEALRGLILDAPRIKAAEARQDRGAADLAAARAQFLPELTVSGGYSWREAEDPLTTSAGSSAFEDWSYSVQLSQPIYQGGRMLAGVRQARAGAAAERSRTEDARQSTLLEAAQAFAAVAREQRVEALRRDNLALVEEIRAAAEKRFTRGAATRTDVALAEAQAAAAEAELARIAGERQAAEAAYARAFGRPPEAVAAPGAIEDRLPSTLGEALDAARRNHPRLSARRHDAQSAAFAATVAAGAFRPDLALALRHTDGEDEFFPSRRREETRLQLQVSVPLVRAAAWGETRAARAQAAEARFTADDAERQALQEAATAFARHTAEVSRSAALTRRAEAAGRAADGVRREHEAGARTMQDVLAAQEQAVQARIDLERASYDRQAAAYALLAAVGRFAPDEVR